MLIGVVRMRFQILKRTHIIRLTQSDIVLPCALQNFICNHEAVEQWIGRSGLCIQEWEIAVVPELAEIRST